MLPFPRTQFLSIATAGAIALMATGIPARANELVQVLGPVGPHEPILTTVGSEGVIAFYSPDHGNCAVHVVLWSSESTTAFQAILNPGQMAPINTTEDRSLYFQCGEYADRLAIAHVAKFIALGTVKQTGQN